MNNDYHKKQYTFPDEDLYAISSEAQWGLEFSLSVKENELKKLKKELNNKHKKGYTNPKDLHRQINIKIKQIKQLNKKIKKYKNK